MDHQNILPKSGDRIAIFTLLLIPLVYYSNTGIKSMYTSVNADISSRY